MPDSNGRPTEAEVMTGFNPAFGTSAEDIEAQQDSGESVTASPEGEGTPGADTSKADANAPAEREVLLDGRTFKAPKDIADAFTREINRRDGSHGAELQGLRERLARVEGRQEASTAQPAGAEKHEGPPIPDPEDMIENPAKYQEQLTTRMRWESEQTVQGLTSRYEEAEAAKVQETERRAAWKSHVDQFYAKPENKVLVGNEDIVDLMLKTHAAELAPLSVEDGFSRLSELAKSRLARVTGSAPEIKGRMTPKPPTLEGSSRRGAAAAPAGGQDEGPKSLSAALKERRRAAAAEFAKGGSPRTAATR